MGKTKGNAGSLGIATIALGAFVTMSAALANPPINQRPPARGALHLDLPSSLDLRPALTAVSLDKKSEAFPSSLHRQALGGQEQSQPSETGFALPQQRIMGRAEEFARRTQREGLPLARLWENKSALVSLGLNQKGKPGLWIVQKIH